MHVFKRFYLLGALMLSMIIPALVFTEYVEAPALVTTYTTVQPMAATHEVIGVPPALEADVLDIEPILWTIYFLGLLFFGLKFIRNLFQIFGRIRKNPKQKLSRFTQVLLQEKIAPHTFFSYIFLNKKKLESNEIPKEVLLHEETHAQQKHSYDVVLVEFLQAIFWVNPLIYFTKKAIKLNHEFLADQAVLKKDIDKATYQNTLLSYLSPDSEKKYQPLANSINYSSIKKRFTVMKTHTSKKAVLLRSLLLLPLLALLVYGFSEKNVIQVEPERFYDSEIQEGNAVGEELENINLLSINYNDSISYLIAEDINVHIDKNGQLLVQEKLIQIENVSEFLLNFNSDLSKNQKSKIVSSFIHIEKGAPQKIIDRIQEILTDYGSATIDIVGMNTTSERIWVVITNENEIWVKDKLVQLDELAEKLSSISFSEESENKLKIQIYSEEILHQSFLNKISNEINKVGASSIQVFTEEYIMPKSEYQDQIDIKTSKVVLKTNKMTFEDSTIKEGASRKQIQQYNALAKKYNAIPIEKRVIPLKDLKILETVFRKMNSSQKENSQSFPECLPKKSQDGASRKLMAEYKTLAKKYNTMLSKSKSIQIKMKDVERLEYIYGLMSKKQKADAEPFPDFPPMPEAPKAPKVVKGEVSDIPPPPAPPKEPKKVKELKEPKAPKVLKGEVSDIPPPKAPNAPKVLNEREEALNTIQKIIKEQDPNDNVHTGVYSINKKDATKILESPPPNPPEPLSPLDHVIVMAKKNAKFYLEGKEITSDKAIEVMKKNKDINIDSKTKNGKRPMVKMSVEPINH